MNIQKWYQKVAATFDHPQVSATLLSKPWCQAQVDAGLKLAHEYELQAALAMFNYQRVSSFIC